MDRIILSSEDVETIIKWRDQNKDLVRRNPAPFKGITLDFPETKISIKAYNDGGKIAFYMYVNGDKVGKITGQQLPGGLLQVKKNTTALISDDVQSVITVYSSLMAFIAFYKPEPTEKTTERRQDHPKKDTQRKRNPNRNAATYIFRDIISGSHIPPRGHHASPAGVFSVRGHYRRYKSGKTVWIKPYKKGNGTQNNKTYKLN